MWTIGLPAALASLLVSRDQAVGRAHFPQASRSPEVYNVYSFISYLVLIRNSQSRYSIFDFVGFTRPKIINNYP